MDQSERLVETHLLRRGFRKVQYEPDGNIPPDFLADGSVAVEVRRLNQNYDGKYALDIDDGLSDLGSDRPAILAPSHYGEVRHG